MAAFSSLALWLALHYPAGAKPPVPKPKLKRPRGRPRKPQPWWGEVPSPKPAWRPRTFTVEAEEGFLAEIDRWKTKLAERRLPATDSQALKWSIRSYYVRRYRGGAT